MVSEIRPKVAPAAQSNYFVELDGIRALAVVAVAVYHWHHPTVLGLGTELGSAGVNLFFVISGFLITRILLGVRSSIAEGSSELWFALRSFFIRRFLRLFPALAAYLLVAVSTGYFTDVGGLLWHVTYLSNVRVHQLQIWTRGSPHLWSLSVEEQFYLVIPFVVFWMRASWLRAIFTAGIVVATITAMIGSPTVDLLPPAAFGGLFTGCLTATMIDGQTRQPLIASFSGAKVAANAGGVKPSASEVQASVPASRIARMGPALMLLAFVYNDFEVFEFFGSNAIARAAFNVGAAGLVWSAVHGRAGRVFSIAPVVRLGQLSYGIYLWHFFAFWVSNELIGTAAPLPLRFATMAALTVSFAQLSFVGIERWFNTKKTAFPYVRPEREPSLIARG